MPTATAPPRPSEVIDTDDGRGTNRRQAPPPPKKPKKSATVAGSRRDRDNHDDPFERRLAAFETSTVEHMRDMRHRAKQARRFVGKNSHQWKKKKVRTTTGMAARAAGVGLAGGYFATRSGVKHGRRAYKRAAPHVRRVAGHTARFAHSYATVYGQHYATTVRRKALRTVARHRVAGRRRQQLRRDPLLHAAMVANGQMSTRNMKIARRAAGLLDPRTKRTAHRARRRRPAAGHQNRPGSSPQQDREATKRADGIRRDPHKPIRHQDGDEWAFGVIDAYPENSAPKRVLDAEKAGSGAGSSRTHHHRHQGGNTVATVATQGTTNPAAVLEQGFKLSGEYNPVNWVDWMQQLRGQAAAFRQASQSYLQLAVFLDLKRHMDPRALIGIYVIAAAMGQAADVFIATANQFWLLYQDRMETNGRGRTMDDESAFFGQR